MSRASEMQAMVTRWESSGLSQRAFCAVEGVTYSTFLHWRRRLRALPAESPPSIKGVAFDAIRVTDDATTAPASPFEVRTSSGTSVSVPADFDEPSLRRLLLVLSTC